MTDEEASETYDFIQKVDYFTGIKTMDFDEAKQKGLIEYMGQDVIDLFLDEVIKQCVNFGICEKADLNVIYTPLNGTGNKPVRKFLTESKLKRLLLFLSRKIPMATSRPAHFLIRKLSKRLNVRSSLQKALSLIYFLQQTPIATE